MTKRVGIDILANYQRYLKQFSKDYEENDKLFELYKNSSTDEEKIINRNKIVEANLPLVAKLLACKYNYNYDINPVYDMDDIIQEANLILIIAIKKYDESKGKFSTYISMKMLPYVYYSSGIPNSPFYFHRGLSSYYKKVKKMLELGYDDKFISEHTVFSVERIRNLRQALQNNLSYEELLETGEINDYIQEQDYNYSNELIGVVDEQPLINKRNYLLNEAINKIDDNMRSIIIDLYGLNGEKKISSLSAYSREVGEKKQNIYKKYYSALKKLRKNEELLKAFLSVDSDIDYKAKNKTYYYKK